MVARRVTKTCIPHDIKHFVTELNIGSTHSIVSRISADGSSHQEEHAEWWGVLLNWDVLPHLRKITINGTTAAERLNSALATAKQCRTLNDKEALDQLGRFAASIPASRRDTPLEVNICGVDETVVMAMANYPALQRSIRTLWFHDVRDSAGESIRRTLPDFGEALAGMTGLHDLSITVGAPAVANFTHFLQALGKFPQLEKLHLAYGGDGGSRPVLDDTPFALGVHKFRPVVPESLRTLSCPYSFIEMLSVLEPFTERTFQNIHDLTLHIDKHRASLDLPFYSLAALQVYIQEADSVRGYKVEGLLDIAAHNSATLRRLALAVIDFTEVMDLVASNPDLEELHIGKLITGNLPVWTAVLDYLLDLRKLRHLTLNATSLRQLSSRMFGTLLTRNPVDEERPHSYEPSNRLETVTIKLGRHDPAARTAGKLPKLLTGPVGGRRAYDLSTHAALHKLQYMADPVPGVDNHRAPEYLWEDAYVCAPHIVFDAAAISQDLYPEYYAGRYLRRSPYSNTSSVVNSDDEMF